MYYRDEVIRYLQANNILALKLDHALSGVGKAVLNQIETTGAGAKRVLYYTSCFTDEYQDVCQRQKSEDIRFKNAVIHSLKQGDVVFLMLKIYFEEILKYKTSDQLEYIKKQLMAVNVHIASGSLTSAGFALGVASAVATGLNLSLNMSALIGNTTAGVLTAIGLYGIVQKAADSACGLQYTNPAFYTRLYLQEIEMMFFLVEPLFERTGALKQISSDGEIPKLIARMIRQS